MKPSISLRFFTCSMLLGCVIATTSCTTSPEIRSAKEVTATQFKALVYSPDGYYSTMFRGVKYVGSDANFDYIALTYGDGKGTRNNVFKVRAGELGLKNHMNVKSAEWVDASADFAFPPPTTK